jgi:rare lipoprotein A
LKAQSLSEAQAAFNNQAPTAALSAPSPSEATATPPSSQLTAPAEHVGATAVGNWSTITATDPPKTAATFDHWQAKITFLRPSFGPKIKATITHHAMKGLASFYGKGTHTATGEAFDPRGLTAAHRTLPFGTRVRVTRVDNGESVIVRINDRGPFKPGRVIDLSQRAAEDLRITDKGLAAVKLEVVDREEPPQVVQAAEPKAPHLVENVAQRSLRR